MRTTITLDADVDLAVRRLMRERGLSFKAAGNEAIRHGIRPRTTGSSNRTRPVAMRAPAAPLPPTPTQPAWGRGGPLVAGETVAFPWAVLPAFLRLATHPAVFPRPLS